MKAFLVKEQMDDNLAEIQQEAKEESLVRNSPVYVSHAGFGVYTLGMAEEAVFGYYKGHYFDDDYTRNKLMRTLAEDAMGGVSAPMATLNNTPGVGNAVPAAKADGVAVGSGDKWGDDMMYDQNGKVKKKKKDKKLEEIWDYNPRDHARAFDVLSKRHAGERIDPEEEDWAMERARKENEEYWIEKEKEIKLRKALTQNESDNNMHDKLEERMTDKPILIYDIVEDYNKRHPENEMKVRNPGIRVWTGSWGSRHREPGSITPYIDDNDDAITEFWNELVNHPKTKSLGIMKVAAIETPQEVYKIGTYYFTPIFYSLRKIMKYIQFGSVSRLKNPQHFRKVSEGAYDNRYGDFYIGDLDRLANEEFGLDFDQLGTGEQEWIFDELAKPDSKMYENNLNPYDKIGNMMAKKMGVKPPFKKKDSRTNTIVQDEVDENAQTEPKYTIETLDSYAKASKLVPLHPLQEGEELRDIEALKDVKGKEAMDDLGIAYEYKPAQSGKKRVFIKDPMKDVLTKLESGEWEQYGKNPENTIRKYSKGEEIITIYADGKDLPRVTLTPKPESEEEDVKESVKIRKVVSNSLTPYIKS